MISPKSHSKDFCFCKAEISWVLYPLAFKFYPHNPPKERKKERKENYDRNQAFPPLREKTERAENTEVMMTPV